ncbi:MAG: Delta-60 repeat-containing protein, partial [Pedosphaera sp.]|nr:Delta-60 repeat-containing protein [Pedosphaera sp.]
MRCLFLRPLLAAALTAMLPAMAARGQAGFLDPGFGGTGMIQIGFGGAVEYGQATAVQSDGLLLVAGIRQDGGQIVVLRLGTNNLPDPSFGSGGLAAFTPPSYPSLVSGVAQQPDGKIVVAGTSSAGNYTLARFNSDGSMDSSFGSGGFVSQDLDNGSADSCYAMVLQPDGKIVTAGETVAGTSFNPVYYMSLARFDTNGTLDSSFGSGGVVLSSSGSYANAMALEGDGNILVTSASGVFRFTTNGIADASFGSGGKVIIPTANRITAVAIQGAGIFVGQPAMIVVAGASATGALVARISLAGALDTTFNGVGYVSKSIGSGPSVTGVRLFASGVTFRIFKILISGDTDGGTNFMAARFNNDGSTDTTFGSSGVALTPITGDAVQDNGLAVMPGPLLVQVGTRTTYLTCGSTSDFVVVRHSYSSGALDTNFYGSGVLVTNIGNRPAEANAVSIQQDGKIVIAGYCINPCGNNVLALCRLNPDSTFDPSFGSGGKLVTDLGPQNSQETPMVIQPDGKIVVAGVTYDGANYSVTVTRFLTNGALDGSFGTGGSVTNILGTNGSYPSSITLQGDGKIVVGAYASVSGNDIAVLRYNTNGSPDTTWNGTGKVLAAIGSSGDSLANLAIQPDGKIISAGASAFSTISKFS